MVRSAPLLPLLALLLSVRPGAAQADADTALAEVRTLELSLRVEDFATFQRDLDSLVANLGLRTGSYETSGGGGVLSTRTLEAKYTGSDSAVERLRARLLRSGDLLRQENKVLSLQDKLTSLERELAFLESQRAVHQAELERRQAQVRPASTDGEKPEDDGTPELWSQIRAFDQQIFAKEGEIAEVRIQARGSELSLTARQESSSPVESGKTWWRFVNMPGIEYTALWVENPKEGLSADFYQGLSVRYMFTRGKSWIVLGALRSESSADDGAVNDSLYSDIFLYGFGTDFYPRHFGRGLRRWFNFYSGFSGGGLFLSSRAGNDHVPFVAPHAGLELFKSERILLDARGSYLVPLSSDVHLNLRGWSASGSLQFAF